MQDAMHHQMHRQCLNRLLMHIYWLINSTFAYEKRFNKIKQYRGKDCVSKFCETIMLEAKRLCKSAPQKPMDESNDKQLEKYKNVKNVIHV